MPLAAPYALPDKDQGGKLSPIQPDKSSASSSITTWTRLTVGAMLYGLDMLLDRSKAWGDREERHATVIEGQARTASSGGGIVDGQTAHSQLDQREEKTRHTLIGLLFDTQSHASKNISTFHRIGRLADRMTYPVMKGMRRQSVFRPIYRGFDRMVRRGESELGRWGEIGKIEEERSREVLKNATITTVDSSIDYLSTNPDIQELVQYQSTSLVTDLIEEVRERAVSVNTIIEGWVRKTLGLVPRSEIPGPPPEVRRRAELFPTTSRRPV